MPASLTEADRARIRYHMGYGNVAAAPSLQLGIPAMTEQLWVVDKGMDNLLPIAIPRVQSILNTMDLLEQQLANVSPFLLAQSTSDGVQLRTGRPGQSTPDLIEKEYVRWARRLSNILAAPLCPYAERFAMNACGPSNFRAGW